MPHTSKLTMLIKLIAIDQKVTVLTTKDIVYIGRKICSYRLWMSIMTKVIHIPSKTYNILLNQLCFVERHIMKNLQVNGIWW